MTEQYIWLQTYIANIDQGIPHIDAMKNAEDVVQKMAVLNK